METLTSGSDSTGRREGVEIDAVDVLAVILSVIAPGVGHIVLGQVLKGVVILALVVASCGVGYVVSAIIALDAFMVARARRVRKVGDWEIFPEHRTLGL
jgi:TM2 domain-containing membrane protein YozV